MGASVCHVAASERRARERRIPKEKVKTLLVFFATSRIHEGWSVL